jgi:hypothetical protein
MMTFTAYESEDDRNGFDLAINPYEITSIEPSDASTEEWNLAVVTMSTGDEYYVGGTVIALVTEINLWKMEQSTRGLLEAIEAHLETISVHAEQINRRDGRAVGESW